MTLFFGYIIYFFNLNGGGGGGGSGYYGNEPPLLYIIHNLKTRLFFSSLSVKNCGRIPAKTLVFHVTNSSCDWLLRH